MPHAPRSSKATIGLLVVAAITVLTLDGRADEDDSPIDPLRTAVGSVLGPVEDGVAAALTPVTDLPGYFSDVDDLRRRNDALQTANDSLTSQLRRAQDDDARIFEIEGVARLGASRGLSLVAAQVVAVGPAQSFSRTVTIDAGSRQGVEPDLTVVNADGLVGRVVSVTPSSATVLLVIDAGSTVGGRLSESRELGFLDGHGDIGATSTLELSLVDHVVSPEVGDTVTSWGSRDGAPYVAGIPIGTVVDVSSSPADLTETATVQPFVDFSSLDVVAVVTAKRRAGSDQAQGSLP